MQFPLFFLYVAAIAVDSRLGIQARFPKEEGGKTFGLDPTLNMLVVVVIR